MPGFIKFDEVNGSIMEPIISNQTLKFISNTGVIYNSLPEETLIISTESRETSLVQYNNFLKNILKDPTNPRKKEYCSSCKKERIIVYIYIRDNKMNTCSKCEKRWIEGLS